MLLLVVFSAVVAVAVVLVVVVFFYWPSLSVLVVSKLSLANGCTSWWRLNKFLSARRISLLRPKFSKGFKSELSNRKKPEKGKVACTFTFWAKAWTNARSVPGIKVTKNRKRITATVLAICFSLFNMAGIRITFPGAFLLQNTPRYEKIIIKTQTTQNKRKKICAIAIGRTNFLEKYIKIEIVALANQVPHIK